MEETLRTFQFIAPSGYSYTIREENGEDEEILSNPANAKGLMNITHFISAIVVATDYTKSGKLTVNDTLNIPLLDRYAILFQSRIFSLGSEVDFTYKWPGDATPTYYSQDLNEMLLDYSDIKEEELNEKPNAIPFYPDREKCRQINFKGYEYNLKSGKVIKFDLMDGNAERAMITLPADKQTRNSDLLARNLHLLVEDRWERVESFRLFTIPEMAEIREIVSTIDPIFQGTTDISNPRTGEEAKYSIIGAPRFFFLTEA